MKTKLWVGGVKSTSGVKLLEDTFGRFGKVSKAETGFPGFAFVEFEDDSDAIEAQKNLDKTSIKGIGKIHVTTATNRGYDEACKKRDDYWRSKGHSAPPCARSRSPLRKRSSSRSSRRRGRRSRSSSRSSLPKRRSRSNSHRSCSASRSLQPPRNKPSKKEQSASRSASHHSRARAVSPPPRDLSLSPPPKRENVVAALTNGVSYDSTAMSVCKDKTGYPDQEPQAVWLSDVDRAAMLCFFDGASAYDMALESATVSKAHNPERMPRFPRCFPDVDEEIQAAMLTAFAGVSSDATKADRDNTERSIEVRQKVIVSADGQRLIRKTLVVDGTVCYSEDKTL